jgi:hypothetical protein
MIPDFGPEGNLPPGIHWATWREVADLFGGTPRRRRLLRGLRMALNDLRAAGCHTVFVDGSFVSNAREPGDFDACWDATGVTVAMLDRALIAYHGQRQAMKSKYRGELFPSDALADWDGSSFFEYFQRDKRTGAPKGIIAIDLGSEP